MPVSSVRKALSVGSSYFINALGTNTDRPIETDKAMLLGINSLYERLSESSRNEVLSPVWTLSWLCEPISNELSQGTVPFNQLKETD